MQGVRTARRTLNRILPGQGQTENDGMGLHRAGPSLWVLGQPVLILMAATQTWRALGWLPCYGQTENGGWDLWHARPSLCQRKSSSRRRTCDGCRGRASSSKGAVRGGRPSRLALRSSRRLLVLAGGLPLGRLAVHQRQQQQEQMAGEGLLTRGLRLQGQRWIL